MSADQSAQIAGAYSWLRAMSGGKLTEAQVQAGDSVIALNGLDVFSAMIGYKSVQSKTGQLDISTNGYEIIKEFEGFRSMAYLDTGGVWTIGFGTIKYPNGKRVAKGDTCTIEQAEQWLRNDCQWVDACLDKYVTVSLTQNQFDALASFTYNVGETAFKSSTLLAKLNKSNYVATALQFDRWVYDNGKKIKGLVNRRAQEKALFLS